MKGDTIMKKIQILAILVIVALVFTGLKGGIEGAVDGWNQAGDSREFDFSTVNVAVKADETLIADSLFNSVAKRNIPYCIETLETQVEESVWGVVLNILMFPVAFAGLYGFFCLIKMVMAVTVGKCLFVIMYFVCVFLFIQSFLWEYFLN